MAQVHPRLLSHKLVELSKAKGAEVRIAAAVGLKRGADGKPSAVEIEDRETKAKSSIPCTDVVIAAGPWSSRVAEKLLKQDEAQKVEISAQRAHSIVIKTPLPLSETAVFTSMEDRAGQRGDPELYARPDGTGYLCGPTDDEPLPEFAHEVEVDPAKIEDLRKWSALMSPTHLGAGTIEHKQACYLPLNERTGSPVIGKLSDGVWCSTGHTCWASARTRGPLTIRRASATAWAPDKSWPSSCSMARPHLPTSLLCFHESRHVCTIECITHGHVQVSAGGSEAIRRCHSPKPSILSGPIGTMGSLFGYRDMTTRIDCA